MYVCVYIYIYMCDTCARPEVDVRPILGLSRLRCAAICYDILYTLIYYNILYIYIYMYVYYML